MPLVTHPNPQKVREIQKMLCFFLIKAKSHRPIGLAYAAVRSDSVTLIQIIGRLPRLRLPCVCHTLSTPFACISHFFAYPFATRFFAICLNIYVADLSTLLASFPEKAPPPCLLYPPYVSIIIFLPS